MRIRFPAVVVLAGLLAAAGCGLPTDDEPRELSAEAVPFDLLAAPSTTSPARPPGSQTQFANLYFREGERLVPVAKLVSNAGGTQPDPNAVITALLETPGQELDPGVRTAIPPDTRLLRPALCEPFDERFPDPRVPRVEALPAITGGHEAGVDHDPVRVSHHQLAAVRHRPMDLGSQVPPKAGGFSLDRIHRTFPLGDDEARFFLHFTSETLEHRLARVDHPARRRPVARPVAPPVAHEEQAIRALDQGASDEPVPHVSRSASETQTSGIDLRRASAAPAQSGSITRCTRPPPPSSTPPPTSSAPVAARSSIWPAE